MSSLLDNPAIRSGVEPISVEQYRRMGEAGIIDTKTELIAGVILRKMIKSPLHTLTVKRLVDALTGQLGEEIELRKEEPLTLESSEPEPDIALVSRGSYDPTRSHPATALLVIEVAINSESLDRAKTAIYAAAQVSEYWLVLPERRLVECFADPHGDRYLRSQIVAFNTVIESRPELSIVVELSRLLD